MTVLVRIVGVRRTAEVVVRMVLVTRLADRHEVQFLAVHVRRGFVRVLVAVLVVVRMRVAVRMRVHHVAVTVLVLVGVLVIVRVSVRVHVAVRLAVIVVVSHGSPLGALGRVGPDGVGKRGAMQREARSSRRKEGDGGEGARWHARRDGAARSLQSPTNGGFSDRAPTASHQLRRRRSYSEAEEIAAGKRDLR